MKCSASALLAQLKLACLNHKTISEDFPGSVLSACVKITVCCLVCIAWTCSLPDVRMHDATHVHSSSQHPYASMQRWTLKAGQGFHRENQSRQMHYKTAKMWSSERNSGAMAEAVQNTYTGSQRSLSHFLSPFPLALCCWDICQQNGNDTVPKEKLNLILMLSPVEKREWVRPE